MTLHKSNNILTRTAGRRPGRRILTLLIMMLTMGAGAAWGQTDYSGTYFLSGNNQGTDSYNIANTTTNYYLCPTVDWLYYKADATNYFTDQPNGQPFITTYQYRDGVNDASEDDDASKAVWRFVKHATLNYYYIIHNKTNKYLVSNLSIKTANGNRLRVHLEETAPTESTQDYYLFTISANNQGYFNISPKKYESQENKYLNITQGNQPSLKGTDAKNDGPTGDPKAPVGTLDYKNIGGTIGLWKTAADFTSKWYIELFTPEISVSNCTFTLSYPIEDNTVEIHYTTDGTAPTASSTLYTGPFTPGLDAVQIKVTAFKTGISAIKSPTVTYDFSKLPTPTCELNQEEGKLTLNTSVEDGIIYYKTGGAAPTINDNIYTEPFSVTEGTIVKAFVAKQCHAPSDLFTLEVIKVPTPTIELLEDNRVQISSATDGVTIYYSIGNNLATLEDPNTLYTSPLTVETGKYFKAIAIKNGCLNSDVATTSEAIKLKCAKPTIKRMGKKLNVSCSFPPSGYTIKYTIADNGGTPADPNSSSLTYTGPIDVSDKNPPITIKAYVSATGYTDSDNNTFILPSWGNGTEADPYIISTQEEFNSFVSNVNTNSNNEADKYYQLIIDVNGGSEITTTFTGSFEGVADDEDGSLPTISGLTHALFNTINDGTVKNIILDNVSISGGTNAGAICNEATGDTRIYNCGVLATDSKAKTDENGYTYLTDCSSSISGSGYVGSIVGLLDGNSRVINCFSYANVSGGDYVGGIVGYNNVETTATNLHTMVMNCMFYGEASGSSIAPIYNGKIITNVGENKGVSNFNYFRLESDYIQDNSITKVYNCALGAETRFLQRFEFFRNLLNSNRELAAWWASTSITTVTKDEMMKWVLEPSQIGSTKPYPILKTPGKYPSVVNIDAEHAAPGKPRNQGGKLGTRTLTVNIQMGDGAVYTRPSGAAITTSQLTLNITDKDTAHFNFNYYKVQLPYYNDVGSKNYTGNRVVTGWKIVSITGGTPGTFTTSDTWGGYNFADRNCTNKDLYGTDGSNRVFNQGAYWDVPYGVTAITIEPYWAKCAYLADAYADVVYNQAMGTAYNVPNVGGGQKYTNGTSYSIAGESQVVYTSMGNAIASSALYNGVSESDRNNQSVYDYAVVLVGNYHHYYPKNSMEASKSKPYTITSIDLDGDNEPDYSYILRFDDRAECHPLRADFINIPGLGMAQKSTGGTGSYNFGILIPKGWYESTNTSLLRFTQFEYEHSARSETDAIIVQGGVMEQWVSSNQKGTSNKIPYIHVGGNVWFKEFHTGCHQDKQIATLHSPISVTGGDYDEFYLTGLYQSNITSKTDNAECYINGGRFGTICGAAQEGINGNISWQIQNADIDEFYAGGLNAAKPVTGNLSTTIIDSHVDIFCGGPKFGDMSANKTVTTTATGCTFGTFFGAGYGGNSYSRYAPTNQNDVTNIDWNAWVSGQYTQAYNSTYGGVSTQFSYQFLPMSGNASNVARIFVEYVKFSLATTHNVTSTLTNCTITGNFYGGGSLGKVAGDVTSILDGCTVKGNVFGAGYSADQPKVKVDYIGFKTEPYYYDQLGTYRTGVKYDDNDDEEHKPKEYTWEYKATVNSTGTAINKTNKILYTSVDIRPESHNLGSVEGDVKLTLTGNTKVGTLEGGEGSQTLKEGTGNVFGGGEQSYVNGASYKVTVNIQGDTEVYGNVFGGGDNGNVQGSTEVNIVNVNGE